MPLVRITVSRGLAPERRRALSGAVHDALVATANVPPDDLFQVIDEAVPDEGLVFSRTYLGIERVGPAVFVQVFLNLGRTIEVKKALYAAIARNVAESAGLRGEDVLVNLVEVPRENWSFGRGLMSYPPAQG